VESEEAEAGALGQAEADVEALQRIAGAPLDQVVQGGYCQHLLVLLVDGDSILATPAELAGASVKATVVGFAKGPKIDGFTYKRRTNQRRRYGHRQQYHVVEITSITKG